MKPKSLSNLQINLEQQNRSFQQNSREQLHEDLTIFYKETRKRLKELIAQEKDPRQKRRLERRLENTKATHEFMISPYALRSLDPEFQRQQQINEEIKMRENDGSRYLPDFSKLKLRILALT